MENWRYLYGPKSLENGKKNFKTRQEEDRLRLILECFREIGDSKIGEAIEKAKEKR